MAGEPRLQTLRSIKWRCRSRRAGASATFIPQPGRRRTCGFRLGEVQLRGWPCPPPPPRSPQPMVEGGVPASRPPAPTPPRRRGVVLLVLPPPPPPPPDLLPPAIATSSHVWGSRPNYLVPTTSPAVVTPAHRVGGHVPADNGGGEGWGEGGGMMDRKFLAFGCVSPGCLGAVFHPSPSTISVPPLLSPPTPPALAACPLQGGGGGRLRPSVRASPPASWHHAIAPRGAGGERAAA